MRQSANSGKLSDKLLVGMYRKMVRIREFEMQVTQLFLKGLIPGTIHLCIGQEAVAVGATSCLRPTDRVLLTHRPHGQALAKGMDPKSVLAEILGREDGCTSGKGGSMHLVDIEVGVMPTLPIVGAGIPIAAGIAFAFRYFGSDSVAMGFFGDGATNIGAFHEAMNLAAVWRLPVVYACENNLYAVTTRIDSATLVTELSQKAKMYGMPASVVDGNDVEAVHAAFSVAVDRARQGGGPTFIECRTYRHSGHSRTDPATYRSEDELRAWKERDPLRLCRDAILERGYLDEKGCNDIQEDERRRIEEAAQFAISSPEPEAAKAVKDVYKDG